MSLTPPLLRGLLPEDPFLETYLVRPGGATLVALAPDERLTVIDRDGGQTAEVTVLDGSGADDAAALGASADAPATVIREALADRDGSLLWQELHARGLDPAEARAIRLFDEQSPPGAVSRDPGTSVDPVLTALLMLRLDLGARVRASAAASGDLDLAPHRYVTLSTAGARTFFQPSRVRGGASLGLSFLFGGGPEASP